MTEIWKDIKGYETLYQVSNLGRVRSFHRSKDGVIMNQTKGCDGYLRVHLCKDGKKTTIDVHRLVAQEFINNTDSLPCVNHKDENKQNNFVYVNSDGTIDFEKSNLEWCSHSYNNSYGVGNIKRTQSKIETWKKKKYDKWYYNKKMRKCHKLE